MGFSRNLNWKLVVVVVSHSLFVTGNVEEYMAKPQWTIVETDKAKGTIDTGIDPNYYVVKLKHAR